MTRSKRPKLYHRTCSDAFDQIGERGKLLPEVTESLQWLGRIVWLSSDPNATRWDLGLTSHTIRCDRMDFQYATSGPHKAVPWAAARGRLPTPIRNGLEHDKTGRKRPHHTWWISFRPVNVRLIEAPQAVAISGYYDEIYDEIHQYRPRPLRSNT